MSKPDLSEIRPLFIEAAVTASLPKARVLRTIPTPPEMDKFAEEHPYIDDVLDMFMDGYYQNFVSVSLKRDTGEIGISIHTKDKDMVSPFMSPIANAKMTFSADSIVLQKDMFYGSSHVLMHSKDILSDDTGTVIDSIEFKSEQEAAMELARFFGENLPLHPAITKRQTEVLKAEQAQRQPQTP